MRKSSLSFLAGMLDPDMFKESLAVMGGGGAAAFIYSQAVHRIAWLDSPIKRALAAAAVGFVGGGLMWNHNRDLAKGAMGAMGGVAVSELIAKFTGNALFGMDGVEAPIVRELSSPVARELGAPVIAELGPRSVRHVSETPMGSWVGVR